MLIIAVMLAARLQWARLVAGLTCRELAKLGGVSSSIPAMIESGQRPNPTVQTLSALAAVLGVSVGWLVNGDQPAPSEEKILAGVFAARQAAGLVPALASESQPPTSIEGVAV